LPQPGQHHPPTHPPTTDQLRTAAPSKRLASGYLDALLQQEKTIKEEAENKRILGAQMTHNLSRHMSVKPGTVRRSRRRPVAY
jgi:hypothetical protein